MSALAVAAGRARRTNWRPSPRPHASNHPLFGAAPRPGEPDPIPRRVGLADDQMPAVLDQADSDCTANMGCELLRFLAKRAGRGDVLYARLFLYYATRVWVEGQAPDADDGAYVPDVLKAIENYGCPPESDWPYEDPAAPGVRYKLEPTAAVRAEALRHRADLTLALPDLFTMRACLRDGFPFGFGTLLTKAWMDDAVASTGEVPYPESPDDMLKNDDGSPAGHAVVVQQIDLDRVVRGRSRAWTGAAQVFGSWGTGYGVNGRIWIPVHYFEPDPVFGTLATDAVTVRRAEV